MPGFFRALAVILSGLTSPGAEDVPAYKDPAQPVDARVADLLGRMTVHEKARQLDMYFGCESFLPTNQFSQRTHANPDAVFDSKLAEKSLGNGGVGVIHDLFPRAALYNQIQAWVMASNRLGIPALFVEEGLHGYMDRNEAVFPQSVNLATTWNRDLARRTGEAIAAQARANGVDMILGPVLDIARDPRWGRVEENFGEDPFLTGQLGLAFVEGMQGESLDTDHTVIAEPKHFAGHGSPEGGLNMSPLHAGEREVRMVMLKSFEPSIRAGKAMGVMAAYHDIDGVPCTGNPWLLNQVLRDEWGFQGIVLSDLGAIRRLYDTHHVVDSPANAVLLALNSGVDLQFYDFNHDVFQEAIVNGIKNAQLSEETLDKAVGRVLRLKFLLGLFDHPFVDANLDASVRRCQAHADLALDSARQSMCLLKNEGSLLPLDRNLPHIAVIGPNSNIAHLGDYSEGATEGSEAGMLAQIKKIVSTNTDVTFADGSDVQQAVGLAKQADVVIVGLGERLGISGEGFDRSNLNLPGNQETLLEAVFAAGKPVVLILQNGRPLTITWAAQHVPAILEAWYPGESGGRAIAETLFGDNNPAGRLTITFPRDVGQLPDFYNHFASRKESYIEGNSSSLFVFGHGLSYTTFHYDQLVVDDSAKNPLVSVRVTNTGSRAGDEVVQLYVHQRTSSVVTPVKSLKGFSRIHLATGGSEIVQFKLEQSDLAIWNANHEWKTEPGEYEVTVGGSSAGSLSGKFTLR